MPVPIIAMICLVTSSIHSYNTRQSQIDNLFVKSVHTTQYGIRSLSYTGPKLWNSLSIDVKKIKPSFDRLINLVKYYAMLRKTAEGNNYGRITTRLTYYKVSFSSHHFVPRSESLSE